MSDVNSPVDIKTKNRMSVGKDYPLAPFPLSSLPKSQSAIPKPELDERLKIMDIEQDTIPCFRLLCPTRFRPFAAYGINSNIFEFVRFEKNFSKLGQTEILVYETEFKYNQNSLKSIPERLIGKVV